MFTPKSLPKPTGLDEAINDVLSELRGHDVTSDEYAKTVTQLERLHKLKVKETPNPQRVSPDTWATIGAHLAGIVLIVGYERTNVITTKAIGFVQKLR